MLWKTVYSYVLVCSILNMHLNKITPPSGQIHNFHPGKLYYGKRTNSKGNCTTLYLYMHMVFSDSIFLHIFIYILNYLYIFLSDGTKRKMLKTFQMGRNIRLVWKYAALGLEISPMKLKVCV